MYQRTPAPLLPNGMAHHDTHARGDDAAERELLALLARAAARLDPVPPALSAAARAAATWRNVDAELAELLADSSLAEDAALAGVRGVADLRLLEFESPALRLDVELDHERTMTVQLVPPGAADVELRHADRTVTARADALGRCVIEDVPHGPVSLRVTVDGSAATIETAWVTL
jgi:hypothetical protein